MLRGVMAKCRELPEDFIEDVIMKVPSPNIMNKMSHSVLALYSFDEHPDDNSIDNVLRQSIQIISQLPGIMAYGYQVKRRNYYKKSMFIHPPREELGMAESILRYIRPDKSFTPEEARMLDLCLMIHAEHGGGNNSAFATRVLSSSGTDTYSALAAGIGSLKGPRHGGANIKVAEMVKYMQDEIADITDEGQVADYLTRIVRKQAGDGSGLIYGMGHAVYTLSDPRAVILKKYAKDFSEARGYGDHFRLLEHIERLTPEIFAKEKGNNKKMCANVDLYSGLIYKMLDIPEDLYTPLFSVARCVGWCAHRIEEIATGGRIIRPAYKSVNRPRAYVPLDDRTGYFDPDRLRHYVPQDER